MKMYTWRFNKISYEKLIITYCFAISFHIITLICNVKTAVTRVSNRADINAPKINIQSYICSTNFAIHSRFFYTIRSIFLSTQYRESSIISCFIFGNTPSFYLYFVTKTKRMNVYFIKYEMMYMFDEEKKNVSY